MKQGERKAIALGDDAAVLCEISYDPNIKVPRLIIYNGRYSEDCVIYPPTSVTVFGESVRDLYNMLHEYYTKDTVCNNKYDSKHGDNRVCECGHTYYRHFDSYENMVDIGCKYCGCSEFKEQKNLISS